jgi:quercetin dioxygenase-like cupin family protein
MSSTPVSTYTEALAIPEGGIASKPLLEVKEGTKLVLFALDHGQEISAHKSPFPASILLLEGSLEVLVGETWNRIQPNEQIALPLGLPHGIRALEPSHFLLTMLRAVKA